LDKFQFQHWALSLIDARPLKEGEGKGANRGDVACLRADTHRQATLPGDVNNEKAAGGILLTLEKPITTMRLICFNARRSPVVPPRRSFGTSANTTASAPRSPA
jgi:hypothetical protein